MVMVMDEREMGKEKLQPVDTGVVLFFSGRLNNRFIALSREINRRVPTKVVLNNDDALPHLTLHEARLPAKNIGRAVDAISKIAEGQEQIPILFNSKSVVAGTIFIEAEISPQLKMLHLALTDELNFLREGLYNTGELELPGITERMRNNLLEYGSLLVGDDFKPHVTVARPVDSSRCLEALSLLPEEINLKDTATDLFLVEMGRDGTCGKVISSSVFRD